MGCGASVHYPEPLEDYIRRLFEAIEDNDVGLMKALCRKTSSQVLRGSNKDKQSPLTNAVALGRGKSVSMLLRLGCEVNRRDKKGDTALVVACRAGNNALVQLLVDSGADMYAKGADGLTPLQIVCFANLPETAYGLLSMMQQMTQRARNSRKNKLPADHTLDVAIDVTDAEGNTPLHCACAEGYFTLAQHLVEFGATLNAQTRGGFTPLMFACREGHLDIVDMLLQTGACELTLREFTQGLMAIDLAIRNNFPEVLASLLREGANPNSLMPTDEEPLLHHCIKERLPACAIKLVEAGADLSLTNAELLDPLHHIVRTDSLPQDPIQGNLFALLVRRLLARGMDVNEGVPLFHACYNGHERIALTLLDFGADPNSEEPETKMSALQAAISVKLYDATADLLARGATSDHMDAEGHSVMDVAIQTEDSNIVLILTTPRDKLPPGLLNNSLRIPEDNPEVPGKSNEPNLSPYYGLPPASPTSPVSGIALARRSSTSALPFAAAALNLASGSPVRNSHLGPRSTSNMNQHQQQERRSRLDQHLLEQRAHKQQHSSSDKLPMHRSGSLGLRVSIAEALRGEEGESESEYSPSGFTGVAPFPQEPVLSPAQHQGPTPQQLHQLQKPLEEYHPPFDALQSSLRARMHESERRSSDNLTGTPSPKRATFA